MTSTISSVRPGDSGLTLVVKVLDTALVLNKPRTANQGPLRISESNVGDSTGIILLSARNAQVDVVQAGKVLVLEGARVEMFKGTMRLAVDGRNGTIKEAEGAPKVDVNKQINMSKIEFDVIPVEGGADAEARGAGAAASGAENGAAE